MAQEPEVIQEQMEETRSALADKLGALTDKMSGTVESVQETVQNAVSTVGQTVETVESAVSAVAESVESTVESVGETAQAAVENVKEAFNIPKQFDNHPWLFFGGSIVLGFVGGKILLNMMPDEDRDHGRRASGSANHMTENMERSSASTTPPAGYSAPEWKNGREHTNGHAAESKAPESESMIGGLLHRFMPDLNKVKELALGTFFATARDLVAQNLPSSMKNDVKTLFNDIAEHAGGKPIEGNMIGEEKDEESQSDTGNQHQPNQQKEAAI